jgi:uncharacterized protein
MIALVSSLSRLVGRAPRLTLVAAISVTLVLAVFAGEVEEAAGSEGMAPDNQYILAIETLAERFGASGEETLQVLVSAADGGDIMGADGARAIDAVTTAILEGDEARHLQSDAGSPPIVSPLGPTLQVLAADGVDLATVDDETVRATFLGAQEQLGEEAAFVSALLPTGADAGVPTAEAALVLVFVGTDHLPADGVERFDALIEIQEALLSAAEGADVGPGYTVSGFSFVLLFSDQDAFEAELARLFTSAFLIILLILATVYWLRPRGALTWLRGGRRTAADVLLTMATIVMAILWMMGAAALLGPGYLGVIGRLTPMTQIIPVLLIGLGVDYAIHLISRYREEVGEGATVADGIGRAMRTVGVALGLATVTTAVGFLTNVFNPIPSLRDFGILAAIGILAAFVLMLTFVPATRLFLDRRAEVAERLPGPALRQTSRRYLPSAMARTAILAERAPVLTLVVTIALGGGLGVWGLSQLETRFSSTDFVSVDHPILAAMDTIEDRFAGGFGETTEVLVTGDPTTPEGHAALVTAVEELAGVDRVTTVGGHVVAESPLSLLGELVAPGPDGTPTSPAVAEAAAEEGMGADLRFPDGADVGRVYGVAIEDSPARAERVLAVEDGAVSHARFGIRTAAGEAHAAALLVALDRAFDPVRAVGLDVVVTSNPIINHSIIVAIQDSQVTSLAITLGVVLLLLVVYFWLRARRPLLGVITTLPVILALLWTYGMMAATGIPFGPVTAMLAAIAIGIGIPYSIHVTNRFLEDRRRLGTIDAVRSTVRHTGGALAGSAMTTCAGFGILVTSSLVPFRQMGLVTVYAIGFALVGATLVLPSALVLWDRWHRGRTDAELPDASRLAMPPVDPERLRVSVEATTRVGGPPGPDGPDDRPSLPNQA